MQFLLFMTGGFVIVFVSYLIIVVLICAVIATASRWLTVKQAVQVTTEHRYML